MHPAWFTWSLAAILVLYTALMFAVGYQAQKRIQSVEDYVVAGRSLNLWLTAVAMVATWFGAESLMTTSDQVAVLGVRGAMLDPFGISVCFILAGILIAGPLWRMKLLTIPDFFAKRYGKVAETVSACVLFPSYFGWIAAQYLAMGILLETFFSIPLNSGILLTATVATGYSLMGGMWSATWTDVFQLGFIVLGLGVLGLQILQLVGNGEYWTGLTQIGNAGIRSASEIFMPPEVYPKVMAALSALTIGAIGNLPIQDLMQRICAAESDRIARRACMLAAGGYLTIGCFPIATGLAHQKMFPDASATGVMMQIANNTLHPLFLLLFLLAVVSAILSTVVSAVLAPAAIVAQNLLNPICDRMGIQVEGYRQVHMQRVCAIGIVICSIALAVSGQDTYSLVEASYSLSLVSLSVPFLIGLYLPTRTEYTAVVSMLLGLASWLVHVVMGWDNFLQPWLISLNNTEGIGAVLHFPHELGDSLLSAIGFFIIWLLARGPTSARETA